MLNFLKCSENRHKINIAPYGETFYNLTYQDKIWRNTFLKFFTIKTFWDGLPVFTQATIYHVRTEMRQEFSISKFWI